MFRARGVRGVEFEGLGSMSGYQDFGLLGGFGI